MNDLIKLDSFKDPTLGQAVDAAGRAIPPMWPLSATVAVNPFLGQSGETLAAAGARLQRAAGAPVTMPRAWYAAKIDAGEILDADIAAACRAASLSGAAALSVDEVKAAARRPRPAPRALPTIAELAADVSGVDWPGILADRFGVWAAGYFDDGQALWAAPRGSGAWSAWRATATHDLTPEILGMSGFAANVDAAPDAAETFTARAAARLDLPVAARESYFHQLLMTLGGWAHLARHRLWTAEMAGRADATLADCLAIRLFWDVALFERFEAQIAEEWSSVRAAHAAPLTASPDLLLDAALQSAFEQSAQRRLAEKLSAPAPARDPGRPALQAAFCIDVRSEVFRRALEAQAPSGPGGGGVETLGFAGFFGLGVSHRRFASDLDEHRLPVLLTPGLTSVSGEAKDAEAESDCRISARAARAWGRFKMAAVSSFAFVEAAGPLYVGKLVRDALGQPAARRAPDPAPRLDPALDLEDRIAAADTVLRAMSLTENFARLVLVVGHGAHVVNAPHASALQCGACGGYSGEVNARLLAGLLNDAEVRAGLVARGIDIPADTLFVGALHDTVSDQVALFADDVARSAHADDLGRAETLLAAAGRVARGERATKLPGARCEGDVARRGADWSQVRPEWALAGCQAFIAAPRRRTAGRALDGRAFLHNYDWRADDKFKVLELIMTAPVVVASWISLQYYGSTVAPGVFGAGDKLLHNVVGGVGVFEGNGGLLRAGLPWQSVHDGETFMHEPLRLSVCVEAPREAMIDILRRHLEVKALFDNEWLSLFAMDEAGRLAWRYAGDLQWRAFSEDRDAPRPGGGHARAALASAS